MAGRRAPSRRAAVVAQTPKVSDAQTQRALDVVTEAVKDLQARRHLEQFTATEPGYVPEAGTNEDAVLHADGVWREVTATAIGAVTDVTAGSSKVTVSPTTGSVVVDVVPANFTGIPMAGISFVGTNNRLAKFSGTTLADTTITDTGILVTINNALNVTSTADFDSSVLINSSLTVNGAVDFDSTLEVDGAVNLDSTLAVAGNVTLGDAPGTDVHMINGKAEMSSTQDDSAFEITLNTTGMTAVNSACLRVNNTSTVSTAAGNNNAAGIWSTISCTESGGGNVLTNIAGFFSASGGDVNEAIRTDAGTVVLNRTGGSTGIGLTSPSSKLHVRVASSGFTPIAGTVITAEDTSNPTVISILSTSVKKLVFGNSTAADAGQIEYDNGGANVMRFRTSSTVALTIDAAGNATFGQALTVTGNAAFNGNTRIGNANTDLVGFYTTAGSAQQTIAALTDNTAGTANDTLQALTDPADAPATADALRDDLVANLIPALRNNFADLAAKVNAFRTALRNVGLLA